MSVSKAAALTREKAEETNKAKVVTRSMIGFGALWPSMIAVDKVTTCVG